MINAFNKCQAAYWKNELLFQIIYNMIINQNNHDSGFFQMDKTLLTGLLGYTLEMWLFSFSTVQLRKQLMVWSSYFWLGALMTKVTGLSTAPESMAHITRKWALRNLHWHNSGLSWGVSYLKFSPFWYLYNTKNSQCCR